jgi:hypothetical protein
MVEKKNNFKIQYQALKTAFDDLHLLLNIER